MGSFFFYDYIKKKIPYAVPFIFFLMDYHRKKNKRHCIGNEKLGRDIYIYRERERYL